MVKVVAVIVLLQLTADLCNGQALPSFIPICRRRDPHLDQCLLDSVEKIRPNLISGIPVMGIPSIDPFYYPSASINDGTENIALKAHLSNIAITGGSKFMINHLSVNPDQGTLSGHITLPHLQIQANYEVEATILKMPIHGQGMMYATAGNLDVGVTIRADTVKRGPALYYNIKDVVLDYDIASAHIQLDNLFNGDAQMGATANQFLNDHWRDALDQIKPALLKTVTQIFTKIANQVLQKYPINVLLPDQ